MFSSILLSLALTAGQTPPPNMPVAPPAGPVWPPATTMQLPSNATLPVPSNVIVQISAVNQPVSQAPNFQGYPVQTPNNQPPAALTQDYSGNGNGNDEKKDEENKGGLFPRRFLRAYWDELKKTYEPPEDEPEKSHRGLPSAFKDPPFPVSEYQGYPLIGVPYDDNVYPLMKAIYGADTPLPDAIKNSRVKLYGWATASGNFSTATNSNSPASYWLVPNTLQLDQLVFRLERQLDSVQQDHIDYGFRSTVLFGIDYRYMTAGGWGEQQLLLYNQLYGWDPTEQYLDVYFPRIGDGMIFRIGRWIACPDIETQFSPDNYLASHSLLFTYDTFTQTGFMFTFKVGDHHMVQAGMNFGDDAAPWYPSEPSLFLGWRWVFNDNNDAFYTCVNQLNSAQFHHFNYYGVPAGHDNYNYVVTTWEHKFSDTCHTKTEAYYMWEINGELGGTPSLGPAYPFAAAGADNPTVPGYSSVWGFLNYTAIAVGKRDYITIRNEVWDDTRGIRSGTPGVYTSHTIGFCHNINSLLQVRPEIGYYSNWSAPAFDNGTKNGIWIAGFDFTARF
jgi:hypothetical protein